MESMISDLVTRFEKGSLSRRELVQGLAMLAAGGTGAAAQEAIDFKSADIDHVSIQVADLQRSVDFYQKMFGFTVISQDQPHGIIRLGNTRTLVSLNHESPAGIVDHFAIGIPRFRIGHKLFETAWRDTAQRSLCRLAHQGPRRDQRADLRSEMTGAACIDHDRAAEAACVTTMRLQRRRDGPPVLLKTSEGRLKGMEARVARIRDRGYARHRRSSR